MIRKGTRMSYKLNYYFLIVRINTSNLGLNSEQTQRTENLLQQNEKNTFLLGSDLLKLILIQGREFFPLPQFTMKCLEPRTKVLTQYPNQRTKPRKTDHTNKISIILLRIPKMFL